MLVSEIPMMYQLEPQVCAGLTSVMFRQLDNGISWRRLHPVWDLWCGTDTGLRSLSKPFSLASTLSVHRRCCLLSLSLEILNVSCN